MNGSRPNDGQLKRKTKVMYKTTDPVFDEVAKISKGITVWKSFCIFFRKLSYQLHMMNYMPRVFVCQSGIGVRLCETPTLVCMYGTYSISYIYTLV